jgi:hypothetical protein
MSKFPNLDEFGLPTSPHVLSYLSSKKLVVGILREAFKLPHRYDRSYFGAMSWVIYYVMGYKRKFLPLKFLL